MENLVLNNMGIVYYVVDKKFSWFHKWDDSVRDDLVSEGMIALMYSAEKFDPNGGKKFGNFAHDSIVWLVRKYVNKQLTNKSNGIKKDEQLVKVDSYDAGVVLDDGEEASSLSEIVGGTTDDERELFELWDVIKGSGIKDIELIVKRREEGRTYQEIGNEIGVSKEIVSRRLNSLKEQLLEYYDFRELKQTKAPYMSKRREKKC
mgnify:CR=1 FL=1